MKKEFVIPACYKNWQKKSENIEPKAVFEFPLFSDACSFTSEIMNDDIPYKIINPIVIFRENIILPRLILRLEEYRKIEPECKDDTQVSSKEKSIDFYMENGIADQIAVLISLTLGVRVKSGALSRIFKRDSPYGEINSHAIHSNPAPLRLVNEHAVLPSALKSIYKDPIDFSLLDTEPYFKAFINLTPIQAESLIRAAKLYRDALWIIETEPQLSWVMLVSAIEVVASENITSIKTPLDIFKEKENDLAEEILLTADENLLKKIAEKFVDKKWIGAKYREFLIKYLPDPPPRRPTIDMRIDWDNLKIDSNKNLLSLIYHYRSKTLHRGVPFPLDMCYMHQLGGIPYELAEKRSSSLYTMIDGKGVKVKVGPILISIFEYIVRNALLKWWLESGNR